MSLDLAAVAAIAGGTGAVISAAVAGFGTIWRARAEERSARARWRVDSQRAAYVAFIGAATAFANTWWELIAEMEYGLRDREKAAEVFTRAVAQWESLLTARGVVRLEGGGDAPKLADEVVMKMSAADDAATKKYRSMRDSDIQAQTSSLYQLLERAVGALNDFSNAAGVVLQGYGRF